MGTGKSKQAPRETPHSSLADEEWAVSSGVICASCGKEVFRAKDGLCIPCWEKREEAKLTVDDRARILSWLPQDILKRITHKSGK